MKKLQIIIYQCKGDNSNNPHCIKLFLSSKLKIKTFVLLYIYQLNAWPKLSWSYYQRQTERYVSMIHTTCVISVLSYCFNLKIAEGNGLGMFRYLVILHQETSHLGEFATPVFFAPFRPKTFTYLVFICCLLIYCQLIKQISFKMKKLIF